LFHVGLVYLVINIIKYCSLLKRAIKQAPAANALKIAANDFLEPL
jgi:hypothetical protein